ncbi:10893_t:CDS:1 [Acaulospora morrowiae]|uniref:10893_t:CDS:1 n=1 Tax=Acaulospora morrowiae TaxID=94023 RepID=A0A9N9D2V5_9GLOM|nr:10893_t:CDS:1 [Acaulospora morrowiae]
MASAICVFAQQIIKFIYSIPNSLFLPPVDGIISLSLGNLVLRDTLRGTDVLYLALYHITVQYRICVSCTESEMRQAIRIAMQHIWRNFTSDQRTIYLNLAGQINGHNINEGLLHKRRIRRGGGENSPRLDNVEGVGSP